MPVLKNQRHERFAQELAKGKTTDEAYQTAGFHAHRGNASRLRANEHIRGRLAEIQGKSEKRAIVTLDTLTDELEEARARAITNDHEAAAVSATMGKAKLHGKIIDLSATVDISKLTLDELHQLVAIRRRLTERGGIAFGDTPPGGAGPEADNRTQH